MTYFHLVLQISKIKLLEQHTMKTLAKPWVKFLISMVSAGVISEIISIRSGQDAPSVVFIIGAVLMYVFI